jgi:hypothetical protein
MDKYLAFRLPDKARHDIEQSRFSASRWAYDADEFTTPDIESD